MRARLFRFFQIERCERGMRVQVHLGHDAAAHEGSRFAGLSGSLMTCHRHRYHQATHQ
jgi:hypothetical protein